MDNGGKMKEPKTFIFGRKEICWELKDNKLYFKHKHSKKPEVLFEFEINREGVSSAQKLADYMIAIVANVAHNVGRKELVNEMREEACK